MSLPRWVRNMLSERRVPYEELHHRPVFTSQEVAAMEHCSGHHFAKVVVVMADNRPVELVLPATRRVLLDRVRHLLGAKKLRLATEDEIHHSFPDAEVGAIPPLDHWVGIPMIADRSLETPGDILMQAGTHEDVIRLSYGDWYDMVRPRLASFSEPMA